MSYDVAVWKQSGALSDVDAAGEFERRFLVAEGRYGQWDPPCPELAELFTLMREQFTGEEDLPWEGGPDGDLSADADGEFVYLTLDHERAPTVVEFIAGLAPALGLAVYDPQAEALAG